MSDLLLHHGTDLLGAIGIVLDDRIDEAQHYAHHVPGVSFARDWRMAHQYGTMWERTNPVVFTTSRDLLRRRRALKIGPYLDTSEPGVHRSRESEELLVGPLARLSGVLLSIDLDPCDLEDALESRDEWEWLIREHRAPPHHLRSWQAWRRAIADLLVHPLVNAARPRYAPRLRNDPILRKAA